MMDFGIATVGSIIALVWIIGWTVKQSPINDKWIPSICGLAGILLGVVAYVTHVPDFPADHWLTAAAVGVSSGLAATGMNEVFKQLKDNK